LSRGSPAPAAVATVVPAVFALVVIASSKGDPARKTIAQEDIKISLYLYCDRCKSRIGSLSAFHGGRHRFTRDALKGYPRPGAQVPRERFVVACALPGPGNGGFQRDSEASVSGFV